VVATASALLLWGMRNHVGRKIADRLGPAAGELGRTLLVKVAPTLVAPFASPLIAPFLAPLARRLFDSEKPADPE